MPTPAQYIPLLLLHDDDPAKGRVGAPWTDSQFRSLFTGVDDEYYPHHGLFPTDPTLLPKGLPEATSNAIKTFYEKCRELTTTEQLLKFIKGAHDDVPGRGLYEQWWKAFTQKSGFNQKLDQAFIDAKLHPSRLQLRVAPNKVSGLRGDYAVAVIRLQVDISTFSTPIHGVTVATLFGPHAYHDDLGPVASPVPKPEYQAAVGAVAYATFRRLQFRGNRLLAALASSKAESDRIWKGEPSFRIHPLRWLTVVQRSMHSRMIQRARVRPRSKKV